MSEFDQCKNTFIKVYIDTLINNNEFKLIYKFKIEKFYKEINVELLKFINSGATEKDIDEARQIAINRYHILKKYI